jgi:hypothetical protein
MRLKYWRQCITQKELSCEFEVGEVTIHGTIVWVESTLVESGKFCLLGKKVFCDDVSEVEVVWWMCWRVLWGGRKKSEKVL